MLFLGNFCPQVLAVLQVVGAGPVAGGAPQRTDTGSTHHTLLRQKRISHPSRHVPRGAAWHISPRALLEAEPLSRVRCLSAPRPPRRLLLEARVPIHAYCIRWISHQLARYCLRDAAAAMTPLRCRLGWAHPHSARHRLRPRWGPPPCAAPRGSCRPGRRRATQARSCSPWCGRSRAGRHMQWPRPSHGRLRREEVRTPKMRPLRLPLRAGLGGDTYTETMSGRFLP